MLTLLVMNDDKVTIREAATLLHVHPNTVRNRIKSGMYEAEKVSTERGFTWLIERDSLTNSATTSESQQLVSNRLESILQELLPAIAERLTVSQEAQEEAEKRDRIVQSGLEYWKAQHELYKHFMTLGLATTAAFAAFITNLAPIETGLAIDYLSYTTFVLFTTSVLNAVRGMHRARGGLWAMRNVRNEDDFKEVKRNNELRWVGTLTWLSYSIALLLFIVIFTATLGFLPFLTVDNA